MSGSIKYLFLLAIFGKISAFEELTDLEKDEGIPYIASIQIDGNGIGIATIFSELYLLTTANSIYNIDPKSITLRVAGNTIETGGVLAAVNDVYIHPDFCPETLDNDIAIIELATPLILNGKVQAVILPNPKSDVLAGTFGGFYGYSVTNNVHYKIGLGTTLNERSVIIISDKACRKALPKRFISKNMFCATGFYGSKECLRDSGTPLVVEKELFGLFSWTDKCNNPSIPIVYTDVTKFVNWILDTTDKDFKYVKL